MIGTITAGGGNPIAPAYTALGTFQVLGAAISFTIPNVSIAKNETLLVALYSNFGVGDITVTIDLNGNVLQEDQDGGYGITNALEMFHWKATSAIVNGTLTFTFGVGPLNFCVILAKFTALAGVWLNGANTGEPPPTTDANPDTGLVALMPTMPQIHWGLVGTNGVTGDTFGTPRNAMVASQSVYGVGFSLGLKEMYRVPKPAIQARGGVTGQTARQTAASVVVYA